MIRSLGNCEKDEVEKDEKNLSHPNSGSSTFKFKMSVEGHWLAFAICLASMFNPPEVYGLVQIFPKLNSGLPFYRVVSLGDASSM